jgi:hypothetical protein
MKRSGRPVETDGVFQRNAAGKGKLRGDPGCSMHAFFSHVQGMIEYLQREDGGPQQNSD